MTLMTLPGHVLVRTIPSHNHSLIVALKKMFLMMYVGQSKITEPYLITLKSSNIDIYVDDISL